MSNFLAADERYTYNTGFGSYVSSESLEGALPVGQNSPQVCNYGLYAEQLSGTAFTVPRSKNLRSWLYRIRPSVVTTSPISTFNETIFSDFNDAVLNPNQLRWDPLPLPPQQETDFIEGLEVVAGAGDPSMKSGLCIYNYTCTKSMNQRAFYSSDGDFLIVPQQGSLDIQTELGNIFVRPCEIVVIPRGIKFLVKLENNEPIRGYALEVFQGHFELPNLGPIGANGLANPRDFEIPKASFEDIDSTVKEGFSYQIINKFGGKFFHYSTEHSPFDVVAWHGNYYPFKYNLTKFNCINTVTFDHPDPSIYTVLCCPTDEPGVSVADFVIFPPRWIVANHTFRPPYYHRNCMSEFMGMIYGKYDAKEQGFVPGGSSLHPCMTAHGPDAVTFNKASNAELNPIYFNEGLAFMFETTYNLKVSKKYVDTAHLQSNYWKCWNQLPKLFTGKK